MEKFQSAWLLLLLFMAACSPEDEPQVETNKELGSFSVSVENITKNSATIKWTDANDPDGD